MRFTAPAKGTLRINVLEREWTEVHDRQYGELAVYSMETFTLNVCLIVSYCDLHFRKSSASSDAIVTLHAYSCDLLLFLLPN